MKRAPDVQRLLDRQQRLRTWPAKAAGRRLALEYLAGKFEPERHYTEREVNEVLEAWHTFGDHSLLRRALCDAGFLDRLPDGSRYWKTRR
jgi:hypothetical protein